MTLKNYPIDKITLIDFINNHIENSLTKYLFISISKNAFEVYKLYFIDGKHINEISNNLNLSKSNIYRILDIIYNNLEYLKNQIEKGV